MQGCRIRPLPSPACRQPGCSRPPAAASPRPAACAEQRHRHPFGTVTRSAITRYSQPHGCTPRSTQPQPPALTPRVGACAHPAPPRTVPPSSQGHPGPVAAHPHPGACQCRVPRGTLVLVATLFPGDAPLPIQVLAVSCVLVTTRVPIDTLVPKTNLITIVVTILVPAATLVLVATWFPFQWSPYPWEPP